MIRLACERLRARRNPGTAIAASKAMIATTIMISTRVKPPRRLLSLFNMLIAFFLSCWFDCDPRCRTADVALYKAALMPIGAVFIITGMLPREPGTSPTMGGRSQAWQLSNVSCPADLYAGASGDKA